MGKREWEGGGQGGVGKGIKEREGSSWRDRLLERRGGQEVQGWTGQREEAKQASPVEQAACGLAVLRMWLPVGE